MIKNEEFHFSTGRALACNEGIVGINPELKVYDGYDGTFTCYSNPLTQQERHELADYMISLWMKYKYKGQE